MPIKFFAIPALDPGEIENDVNRFLRGHRVVSIDRKLITVNDRPVWCLAVEYVDGNLPQGPMPSGRDQRARIDYKEVLSDADFPVFNELRKLRKGISEEEGVPVYAVFTNEQLAAIAQKRPHTMTELQKIEGIGTGKSQRYGDRVLAVVASYAHSAPSAAASAEPPPMDVS